MQSVAFPGGELLFLQRVQLTGCVMERFFFPPTRLSIIQSLRLVADPGDIPLRGIMLADDSERFVLEKDESHRT